MKFLKRKLGCCYQKEKIYSGLPKIKHNYATATHSNILKTLHRPNKTSFLTEGACQPPVSILSLFVSQVISSEMSLHLPSLYPKCHIFISDSQIQLPTQHLHLDASNSSQIQFVLNEINDLLTLHLLKAGLPWTFFWVGVVKGDKNQHD